MPLKSSTELHPSTCLAKLKRKTAMLYSHLDAKRGFTRAQLLLYLRGCNTHSALTTVPYENRDSNTPKVTQSTNNAESVPLMPWIEMLSSLEVPRLRAHKNIYNEYNN